MSKKQRVTRRRLGEVCEDLTDWAAVDALSENDLAEAIRNDPDDEELERGWLERAARADIAKAMELLDRAGDEPPREGDEIPELKPAP